MIKNNNMKVVLKRTLKSAKFNVVFKSGMAMNYSPELKSVQHPFQPNIWLVVKDSQFEVAKNYVICGDNNYWYSTTGYITKKQLKAEIAQVKKGIKEYLFDNDEMDVSELHVFEVADSETIEL
jgi:hypothetical protein